jgi:hypothetical protein
MKELMSIEEFMDTFSMTRSATYKDIKIGKLMVKKRGRRTYVTREAAQEWKDMLEDGK